VSEPPGLVALKLTEQTERLHSDPTAFYLKGVAPPEIALWLPHLLLGG
jgi:hypothetical protein